MKKAKIGIAVGLILASLAVLLFTLSMFSAATETGNAVGGIVGNTVGRAMGSVNGYNEGWRKGKEDAIKVPEISVDIANTLQSVGNLEIMDVSMTMRNVYTIGEDYAALYVQEGHAVFSVDLNKVIFPDCAEGTLIILLPEIEVNVYADVTTGKLIEEYQKSNNSGSTEDAAKARLEADRKSAEGILATMRKDADLNEQAKQAAQTQVEQLAKNLCGSQTNVSVGFMSEESGNE